MSETTIRSFKETIHEPTPFSEGKPVQLTLVEEGRHDSAKYKDADGTLFEVSPGSDGKWHVSYS